MPCAIERKLYYVFIHMLNVEGHNRELLLKIFSQMTRIKKCFMLLKQDPARTNIFFYVHFIQGKYN